MPNFFETRSYWHGGFTKDQQEYYKEHRLSQKGIHLWKLIHQLYEYARNLCSIYNISFCRDESCCFMIHKHLSFQCEYNDDETLASYAKEIMIFMMQRKLKNLLLLRVPMKLLLFLKILMMALTNPRVLLYLTIALKITMQIIILLIILRESLPQRKGLTFCKTLWKKKLLQLKAPWMKKRRRVTNKKRKNGDMHVYLLMRVTL